jgi:hydrogenase nickel incorporation protein HypA/HybF
MTHELSLLADLMRKIQTVSHEYGDKPVLGVTLKIGALAPISPDHLREHFERAARGTAAAGSSLTIHPVSDPQDPHATDIMLESLELAD